MEHPQRFRTAEDLVLIGLFIAAICVPALRMITGPAPARVAENRVLAPFPRLAPDQDSLAAFPGEFGRYLNDNFGFRGELVRWQANVKVKYLHLSSSSRVIVGKDDWLFYNYLNEEAIAAYQSDGPLTETQLARWRQVLIERRDWLAERGIGFLFVIAPEKQSIYSEYLPDNLVRRRGPSRLDQLVAEFREHPGVEILDLRPFLLKAKETRQVYLKTDTHWNAIGAYTSYQAIMEKVVELFPILKPLRESDLYSMKSRSSGDLTRMLGVYDLLSEEANGLYVRDPLYTLTPGEPGGLVALVSEHRNPELPRLLVFGDSFGNTLAPLLSQHFGWAMYTNQNSFDPERVEVEKPNLVIEETVERYLFDEPPPTVPMVTK